MSLQSLFLQNRIIFTILFVFNIMNIGCNIKNKSHPDTPPPISDDVKKEETSKKDKEPLKCPWNLQSHPIYNKFKAMDVEILVNCEELKELNVNYTEDAFNKAIQYIDNSFESIKNTDLRPIRIKLGVYSLHDSKKNLLQIPLIQTKYTKPNMHFIESTIQLMKLEQKEFSNRIRISYSEIKKIKSNTGSKKDLGTTSMFTPSPEVVKSDLEYLLKFKRQILEHAAFYPDVVLFHGNKLSYYEINDWDEFYFFTPEAGDELNSQFFNYLNKYEGLLKISSPMNIKINVARYWTFSHYDNYFQKSNEVLELIRRLMPSIQMLPINTLEISASSSDAQIDRNYIELLYSNKTLRLRHLYNYSEEIYDFEKINICIDQQDYGKTFFSVKCSINQ